MKLLKESPRFLNLISYYGISSKTSQDNFLEPILVHNLCLKARY